VKVVRGHRRVGVVIAGVLTTALAVGTAVMSAEPAGAAAGHSATLAKAGRTPFPGKGPRAILNLSAATMAKASTVHVKSRFTANGMSGSSEWTAGVTAGTGVSHGISGGTYRVIRVGSEAWLLGDATFWSGKNAPQGYVNRWVKLVSADYKQPFAAFTYVSEWSKMVAAQRPIKRVAVRTVHGVPTLGLRDRYGVTLYVATRGKPYPVELTYAMSNGQSSTDDFDRWNLRYRILAPSADQVAGSI